MTFDEVAKVISFEANKVGQFMPLTIAMKYLSWNYYRNSNSLTIKTLRVVIRINKSKCVFLSEAKANNGRIKGAMKCLLLNY